MTWPWRGSTSTPPTDLAESSDDLDLQARAAYYLAYVVSHHGEFREALALTDRSRAIYDGLDRPWDQAANALFAARAAISAADEQRSIDAVAEVERWLEVVEDPWLHARGEAIKGELARVQHRFEDAVVHLASAVEASHRLGFLQTEAYQLSSLGRAQCQAGDYAAGVVTLRTSIDKAEATGDVRLAALIRVHLGRALRAEGDLVGARAALASATAWHREAGGGEQALLGECLLAALDAADGEPLAQDRLVALLDRGARAGRRPRGGLRTGRPRPAGGRLRSTRPRPESSSTGRTAGWRRPRTSSRITTGPTRTGYDGRHLRLGAR